MTHTAHLTVKAPIKQKKPEGFFTGSTLYLEMAGSTIAFYGLGEKTTARDIYFNQLPEMFAGDIATPVRVKSIHFELEEV